ncbi:glutaminase [Methylohalomonas lacus]|uniref:Glutaminase n=1 Tax=Methylohalomonas lacus TaxID=398773 RepID=A0AAE3HK96_9GAMM|nr:glutaminase [Methylohalomonas lacus]MCS3902671.1 glutaminase [Methylohalomonas lacus]
MKTNIDYQSLLEEIHAEVRPLIGQGKVADYIPPLAGRSPQHFGMSLRTIDGNSYSVGEAHERFSIQSIAKVFNLTRAMQLEGDDVWKRVGREPSGAAFNSLGQLENEHGIPRNPMINAGALVVMDIILNHTDTGEDLILDIVRDLAMEPSIDYDLVVAEAEHETGHRNRASAWLLKTYDNLDNPVERVLQAYFRLCSLSMSCAELATAFHYLAAAGTSASGAVVASERQVKRINSVMLTCGVYDEAGDYAYRVGLPAKSGVGGGIVAVMPGEYIVTVWSPGLSEKGNSLVGTKALELLTTKTQSSIF